MRPNGILAALPTLFLLLAGAGVPADDASADGAKPFVIQGSTTFTHRIMEPFAPVIEASSGHKLTVVPTKSSQGLLALFERRADFAMISGPLKNEIADLRKNDPDLPFGQLQTFDILTVHMAFAINRDNPVHQVSDAEMRRILLGEITNWHAVGGLDLPISIVMVGEGGGVQSSIENEFLGGRRIKAVKPILVQGSAQVVKITAIIPAALGLSQTGMVKNSNCAELKIDTEIAQHLALVTLGDPTPEMRTVIDAARKAMSATSASR
jgi:ABC-type phosphate transport system substrate-binding protein